MTKFGITGLTLSVEFGDTSYGSGTKSFLNLHARIPEGDPVPVDNPTDAIEAGLDMYLTAWKTLMMSRLAVATISKADYVKNMTGLNERFAQMKAKLKS